MLRTVRIADDDIWQLNRFYKRNGHKGKAAAGDECWGLYHNNSLCAGVRLSQVEQGYLLRGLWVAKDQRRAGLGSRLLLSVINHYSGNSVWCYPFEHLRGFYQAAGFRTPDPTVPPALQSKLEHYRRRGETVCLMINTATSGN